MMNYWFKPKRFWGWFAAYYPVSWQGWVVTLAFAVYLVRIFTIIDATSYSVSDTFIAFAIWGGGGAVAFDIVTRLFGEYPSWWKSRGWGRWRRSK